MDVLSAEACGNCRPRASGGKSGGSKTGLSHRSRGIEISQPSSSTKETSDGEARTELTGMMGLADFGVLRQGESGLFADT